MLQFLQDFLPKTSIRQIYLHHHTNTKLPRNIQLRADQNRFLRRIKLPLDTQTTMSLHSQRPALPFLTHTRRHLRIATLPPPALWHCHCLRLAMIPHGTGTNVTTAPPHRLNSLRVPHYRGPQVYFSFAFLHNQAFPHSPLWSQ